MTIRVLVVDDSSFFRRRLTEILSQDAELEVIATANNGKEAVEKALALRPDVITMDIEMPVMDGIAFLKAVKQLPAYRFTPVIMLTTESEESKKREGQAAGAKAWVVKPFQPDQLIGAVQRLCLP